MTDNEIIEKAKAKYKAELGQRVRGWLWGSYRSTPEARQFIDVVRVPEIYHALEWDHDECLDPFVSTFTCRTNVVDSQFDRSFVPDHYIEAIRSDVYGNDIEQNIVTEAKRPTRLTKYTAGQVKRYIFRESIRRIGVGLKKLRHPIYQNYKVWDISPEPDRRFDEFALIYCKKYLRVESYYQPNDSACFFIIIDKRTGNHWRMLTEEWQKLK